MTIILFGLYSSALYAIGAVGFTMQFGVTNVLNLAFGSILTACIFIEYYVTGHSTNVWLAMLVGGAAGSLLTFIVGFGVVGSFLRRGAGGFSIAMVTIGIGLMIQYTLAAIQGPYIDAYSVSNTTTAISISGVDLSSEQLIAIIVAIAVMVIVHVVLRRTKLGLAMRATADDASLTRSCGISPARTRAVAWLISGALCGICGVFYGIGVGTFGPFTGQDFFITAAAAAIVGGVGKPYGAMIGALIIGLVSQASGALIGGQYAPISAFVILVGVLMFRPQGIFAEFASERELVA
jgi:branched-subunit amino acid ABC-type transport system permease component